MKTTIISDLHGYKPKLPGGDLLLLCGDYTAWNRLSEWRVFFEWLKDQKYPKKIMIGGNHDGFFESFHPRSPKEAEEQWEIIDFIAGGDEIDFLWDNGIEFEGLKLWGSPWTNLFDGVNPVCTAFMDKEEVIADKFDMIPERLDILMTHSPPFGVLDESYEKFRCGSMSLKEKVLKVKPRYHFFGHIHECGGQNLKRETEFYNVSYCDRRYKPRPEILTLDID